MKHLCIVLLALLLASCHTTSKVTQKETYKEKYDSLCAVLAMSKITEGKTKDVNLRVTDNFFDRLISYQSERVITLDAKGDTISDKTRTFEHNKTNENAMTNTESHHSDSTKVIEEYEKTIARLQSTIDSFKQKEEEKPPSVSLMDRIKNRTWLFLLLYSLVLTIAINILKAKKS